MILPDMGTSGVLHFSLKVGVQVPFDWFQYRVDGGEPKYRWYDPMVDFKKETVEMPKGQHIIEFEYVFNPLNISKVDLDIVPVNPNRTGVVYLDDVYFVPNPPCKPLEPNPYDFEGVSFLVSPWSTTGEGDNLWSLTKFGQSTSLRSPVLEGGKAESNATLQVCDDFDGGYLQFQFIASVLPPWDLFIVSIDGEPAMFANNVTKWKQQQLGMPPGPHTIDFTYQFNLGDDDVNNYPSPPIEREGEHNTCY